MERLRDRVPPAIAESRVDPAGDRIHLPCDDQLHGWLRSNRDGRPLRPAIIWMDVRANAEADAVLATGDPALITNGGGEGPVSAEWMIPKALWIARNEPEIFRAAHTICEYQDFMTLRLTGERAASPEQRHPALALSDRSRGMGDIAGPSAGHFRPVGEVAAAHRRSRRRRRHAERPGGG